MSKDKKVVLDAFNKHFYELVEDVSRIFPNDMTIIIIKNSLSLINMVKKNQIIQVFKTNIIDCYSKEIEKGDLSFFIDKDYKQDVINGGGSNLDFILEKIEYIKGLVKLMNKEEQEIIIKYFKNLTNLCNVYYE